MNRPHEPHQVRKVGGRLPGRTHPSAQPFQVAMIQLLRLGVQSAFAGEDRIAGERVPRRQELQRPGETVADLPTQPTEFRLLGHGEAHPPGHRFTHQPHQFLRQDVPHVLPVLDDDEEPVLDGEGRARFAGTRQALVRDAGQVLRQEFVQQVEEVVPPLDVVQEPGVLFLQGHQEFFELS